MFESMSSLSGRPETPLPRRIAGYGVCALWLGATVVGANSVQAAVNLPPPKPPMVALSSSADYPEMTFVVYQLEQYDPWRSDLGVNPTTAKIVPTDTGVELPLDKYYAFLAVPAELAAKAKGIPDPAWLAASAPGVVRVPGTFLPPYVFGHVVLRYRLEKTDKGPKLTLLNPADLKEAQRYPQYGPDQSAEGSGAQQTVNDSTAQKQPFLLGVATGGGGVLVLVVGVWLLLHSRGTRQAPASSGNPADNPRDV